MPCRGSHITPPPPPQPPPHPPLQLQGLADSLLLTEVGGSRKALAAACALPESSIAGFRAPSLTTGPRVRQAIKNAGFQYDRCEGCAV